MDTIDIDKKEVLRYLGYKNQILDYKTDKLIENCIFEIQKLAEPKYIYSLFKVTGRENTISLDNGLIELKGNAISNHLRNSEDCVLLAVTLGNFIDTKIRYYEKTDMTRALILDACATAYVEQVCDMVCNLIKKEDILKNKSLTYRFSPGYGDLPLDIQKSFLGVLAAEKNIGLTASSNNILLPRKSVTAVIGVVEGNCKHNAKSCLNCNKNRDCMYKKEV